MAWFTSSMYDAMRAIFVYCKGGCMSMSNVWDLRPNTQSGERKHVNHAGVLRSLLLEFYVLATSKVLSGREMAVHIHGHFIVLPHWEFRPPHTMTQYPTQSHYPVTELTSPCAILLMSSTRLGSDKYQFDKSSPCEAMTRTML